MKTKKDLPTLTDSDIVTNQETKKTASISPMKMSTLAMAIAMTTASGTMLSSCSDGYDCDSDVTTYGDPSADSYDVGAYDTGVGQDSYDYGQYDTTDTDVTNTADNQCD